MTTRYVCLICQGEGPQSELPDHKCKPTPKKPDPLDELAGQVPERPEPTFSSALLGNRPLDYGMRFPDIPTKETP